MFLRSYDRQNTTYNVKEIINEFKLQLKQTQLTTIKYNFRIIVTFALKCDVW
jgi:hypothetical protein